MVLQSLRGLAHFALLPDAGGDVEADGQTEQRRVQRLAEHQRQARTARQQSRNGGLELIAKSAEQLVAAPHGHDGGAARVGFGASQALLGAVESPQNFGDRVPAPAFRSRIGQVSQVRLRSTAAAQTQQAAGECPHGAEINSQSRVMGADQTLGEAKHGADAVDRRGAEDAVAHGQVAALGRVQQVDHGPQIGGQDVGAGREIAAAG